eukprot:1157950-Pelagomonas_calceolata.AAC.3
MCTSTHIHTRARSHTHTHAVPRGAVAVRGVEAITADGGVQAAVPMPSGAPDLGQPHAGTRWRSLGAGSRERGGVTGKDNHVGGRFTRLHSRGSGGNGVFPSAKGSMNAMVHLRSLSASCTKCTHLHWNKADGAANADCHMECRSVWLTEALPSRIRTWHGPLFVPILTIPSLSYIDPLTCGAITN